MVSPSPNPVEPFDTWLLRHVAQPVEAGEVPAGLLAELQAEIESSRDKPPEQSHAKAMLDIAVELGMPVEKVEAGLAALEAKPRVIRELLMQRIGGGGCGPVSLREVGTGGRTQ